MRKRVKHYISKDIENRNRIFRNGVLYTVGRILPVLFAVATALPVLAVAWILAFSVGKVGEFYGKLRTVQKWLNIIVGVIFIAIGIYYCVMMYL